MIIFFPGKDGEDSASDTDFGVLHMRRVVGK